MKAGFIYIAIFVVVLAFVPMIAMAFELEIPNAQTAVDSPSVPPASSQAAQQKAQEDEEEEPRWEVVYTEDEEEPELPEDILESESGVESFLILDESTGQVTEVGLRDFVRGAVAAEMPVNFHVEALKAQAVAAHTYALHNHLAQQDNPDPDLKGADFSADPSNLKVYMTEEDARAFYGDNADRSWQKICDAADSVLEYVLEYDDEPIVAAYHAISAGRTEDASNVWVGSAPYLRPAESEGDLLAPDYETVERISVEELSNRLATAYPDIVLGEDPEEWFGQMSRSDSGYVVEIEVGDSTLHGKEIRQLLDLRSHNFEVDYEGDAFTFQVVGYGHGVGMSQYGADFMARQGYGFDEILQNYFTDTTLKRVAVVEE